MKREKIYCFLCENEIKKGQKYWTIGGVMPTCSECSKFVHGDELIHRKPTKQSKGER